MNVYSNFAARVGGLFGSVDRFVEYAGRKWLAR